MENTGLLALLEADREMIMAGIARDRRPEAAQAVLEKAVDRVTLRYVDQCGEPAVREAAQLILRTVKQALPLMDSTGEVRRWRRTSGGADEKRRGLGGASLALLLAGAALVLGVMLALMLSGGRAAGALTFVEALLPAALGVAAAFWAGARFAAPRRAKGAEPEADVRDEFLVDPDRVWHTLRGMLLTADGALDGVRAGAEAGRSEARSDGPEGALPEAQAELFAGLLENAYAQDGADAREMIESMRFYLHAARVDVVDWAAGREAWFEFLPARRPGTIRPALVSDGRLIRKGVAAKQGGGAA